MTESDPDQSRTWLRRVRGYVLPAVIVIIVGGAFVLGTSSGSRTTPSEGQRVKSADAWSTKLLDQPAFAASPAAEAATARIRPDARVIGVSVGDHRRAYVIDSLSHPQTHVVNDLIGGTPVTVAFCDRTQCARAFTAAGRDTPLELAVGGWLNEGGARDMLLRVGTHRYHLKTGQPLDGQSPAFPYEEVEVEVTTWREWRTAHPKTDVFLGGVRKL